MLHELFGWTWNTFQIQQGLQLPVYRFVQILRHVWQVRASTRSDSKCNMSQSSGEPSMKESKKEGETAFRFWGTCREHALDVGSTLPDPSAESCPLPNVALAANSVIVLCAGRVPVVPVHTTAAMCGTAVRSSLGSARLPQWSQLKRTLQTFIGSLPSQAVPLDRRRVSWARL